MKMGGAPSTTHKNDDVDVDDAPPTYQSQSQSNVVYGRRMSPPGSPNPRKCCFEPPNNNSSGRHSSATAPIHFNDMMMAKRGFHPQEKDTIYTTTKQQQPHNVFLCCCVCPTNGGNRTASVFASLGVCVLVVGYTIIGAFTFMALEGGTSTSTSSSAAPSNLHPVITDLRSHTVDRLWSITENLNILYRENWTRLAAEEVLEFQEALVRALRREPLTGGGIKNVEHRWSFSSSFLYSLTLITTIGYGSVSPRTAWGKLVTILYALIGIPLMLIYLSTTGDVLARSFRRLYGKLCGINTGKSSGVDCSCATSTVKVPITLCLILVLGYICCGAVLFHRLENWSMLEGSYFCFTSLGTIGFGDLIPGQHAEEISLCACSVYILAGMALVAMCVSLVQEEASSLLRLIGASCSSSKPSLHLPPEEISMSVVGS